MESLNRMATELVDEAIDFADELDVAIHHLDNEAVVLDFGVEAPGGIEAGLLLAEIQTGGLATVSTRIDAIDGVTTTMVELSTDHPRLALLCSGLAGWAFDDHDGLGSGPARLFDPDEPACSDGSEEAFDFAVLAVESTDLPGEALAETVARRTGVSTSGVFLPTAPAASLAGSVAIAARAAAVAVRRLARLGYDPDLIDAVTAAAPLPPIARTESEALAVSNDAIAYGSRVHLVVEKGFDRFDELPFGATAHAGSSFDELLPDGRASFAEAADAFAPASATIDVRGGPTHVVGEIDEPELAERLDRCG